MESFPVPWKIDPYRLNVILDARDNHVLRVDGGFLTSFTSDARLASYLVRVENERQRHVIESRSLGHVDREIEG
jgi:hypothetical protein